jgi:hypothetical protein
MKLLGSLLFIALISFQTSFAQSDDVPLDESLIIKLAKTATGGYLSKMDLGKAKTLEANEREAVIVSFDYVCTKSGYEANIHNTGAELSEQILNHLKNAKIGTKVSFENIRVDNASGEVLAKPLLLTVKS